VAERRRRAGLWVLLGLVAILAAAFGVARWYFSGPRLGRFLVQILFNNIRGRVEIDSVDWPMTGLVGRRLPVEITGLRIFAPEDLGGDLVLFVPHATALIDWPDVVLGRHDATVDDLVVEHPYALVREVPVAIGEKPFEVGFIAALEPREFHFQLPVLPGMEPPKGGPIVYLRRIKQIEDATVFLEFHTWNAHIFGCDARGFLRQSFRTPGAMDFTYGLDAFVRYGSVEFAKQHFDVVNLHANRFGSYPNEKDALQWNAAGKTVEGADIQISGKLGRLYDPDARRSTVELRVDAHQGGRLIGRLARGTLGGHPAAKITITGSMAAPQLAAEARGIDIVAAVPGTIDHAALTLALGSGDLVLGESELRALRGTASLTGRGNLTTEVVTSATLRVSGMDLRPYLPPRLVSGIGSELSGTVHFVALPYAVSAHKIDLTLGRLALNGRARLLGAQLLPDLDLAVNDASAKGHVRGSVNLRDQDLALAFEASAANLGPTLARLGVPNVLGQPLLRALDVSRGTVRGKLTAPTLAASAKVIGLPLTPRLDADLVYAHAPGGGSLDVRSLSANPMGGSATAAGRVVLGRSPRFVAAKLDATGLDLAAIPGTGQLLAGRAGLRFSASGPLLRPTGKLEADADGLTLAGVALGAARLRATGDEKRGLEIGQLRVGGDRGVVEAKGRVGWAPYRLDLDVTARDVALSLYPEKAPRRLDLDGKLSAELHLAGTAARPTASGRLSVVGLALLDTILGAAAIDLEAQPDGRMRIRGDLFQHKIGVDAMLALGGPRFVDLRGRVTFNQFDVDELAADALGTIGAHAWISGTVDVATAPALRAEAHLDRVRVELEGVDADGQPSPVIIDSDGPVVASYDDGRREVKIVSAAFKSKSGGFTLQGSASPQQLALALRGRVQLGLLEFYTRRWLDSARGSVDVDVALGGSQAKPTLAGKIAFNDAAVRPHGQEGEIRVPAGELVFSLDRVEARGVRVEIDGQQLVADGTLGLQALKPVSIDGHVEGRIAGQLLELLPGHPIAHAAGSAAASLTVRGDPKRPMIYGFVEIDRSSRLEIAPRALRREVILTSGRIRFTQQELAIEQEIVGTIDEGRLKLSGRATITPTVRADITADVDRFTYRDPQVLEVELGARLRARYPDADGNLMLGGDVDILDGRFVQKVRFDLFVTNIIVPERTTEATEPFWKGSPLLENMALDLNVGTTGTFAVTNQLAKLTLKGRVNLSGTPPNPVFDGNVTSVGQEGTVTIPATKIREFAVSQVQVTFTKFKSFPTETPYIQLEADAPFIDLSGTEHRVSLEIKGTLSRLGLYLTTSTGLTMAQTLALITTGRTTDELRERLRGDASSAAAGGYGPQATLSQVSATDEVLNAISGDILDALAADAIRNILSLDCFSLSVSAASVRASACKKLGDIVVLSGDYEQGTGGWYRYDAGFTVRPADNLSFVLQLWGLKSLQESETAQNELRLQLKYKFQFR
jgi:autotransporter translocation and assembly factor TamB